MKKMSIEVIVITVITAAVFVGAVAGLIHSAVLTVEEPEAEEEIILLTDEEMEQRPLLYPVEEEPAAVLEEPENEETFKYYEEIPLEKKIQFFTQNLCKEYGVSYGFFIAILESESSFDKDAVGDGNKSIGYMQINKPNWERYDLDAFMVYDNLEIGIRMLSELIEKYPDVDDVVMGYKAGESALKSFKDSGVRLSVCDVIIERTIYWNQIIDK